MPDHRYPQYVKPIPVGGRIYLYFRHKGVYQRLPDDSKSPEFFARYAACLEGLKKPSAKDLIPGSVKRLIADFKGSPEFDKLADKTREYHVLQLDRLAPVGQLAADGLELKHILALRDKLRATPRTADQFVAVVRRLYSWAVKRGLLKINPVVKYEEINDGTSYRPWTPEEMASFEASNPPTWMLTAYMIARYAAPRRGDVLALTRANYNGETLKFRPGKTKRTAPNELEVPVHERLKAYLDDLRIDVGLLVPAPDGKAWNPSHFSNTLRAHLNDAGLTDIHFHGLRHTCATSLAEAGASEREIMAVTGHTASDMVSRYARKADQKKLARSAIAKLERSGRT